MSELIERLRRQELSNNLPDDELCSGAADEIESLTADNKWAGEQLINSGIEIERLSSEVGEANERAAGWKADSIVVRADNKRLQARVDSLEGFIHTYTEGEFVNDLAAVKAGREALAAIEPEGVSDEWTTDKPTEPGYYWWRLGDRIEPCQIRRVADTLEAWFIGEPGPLIDWQWQPDWRWMKSVTEQGDR